MANFYIAVSVKQDRNETTFTERKNPEYNPGYNDCYKANGTYFFAEPKEEIA